MAVPAVVWGLIELTALATTAYELYTFGEEVYDSVKKYEGDIGKAKEQVKKMLRELDEEIRINIDEKNEAAFLHKISGGDVATQSATTKNSKARKGDETGAEIKAAISQPIPFRKVIAMVCEQANKTPILNLRKRKGIEVKDVISKKKIILEMLRIGVDELGGLSEEDINAFIQVQLKQLVASHMFEFIDELLEWRSPIKTEVSFGPEPGFADPKFDKGVKTRLERKGYSHNPFYPAPHRGKGTVAADLLIPDYRGLPCKKDNVFSIIEIKFPGDRAENKQFIVYRRLSEIISKEKSKEITLRRTNGKGGVSVGTKIGLFRYPEDIPVDNKKTDTNQEKNTEKTTAKNKKGSGR